MIRFNVWLPDLVTSVATGIPFWLNGGCNKKPHAGRRSRYFQEWIRANGGPPARKGLMTRSVFVKRWARVAIDSSQGLAPYSFVKEILEWNTGSTSQSVTQSSKAPNKC